MFPPLLVQQNSVSATLGRLALAQRLVLPRCMLICFPYFKLKEWNISYGVFQFQRLRLPSGSKKPLEKKESSSLLLNS